MKALLSIIEAIVNRYGLDRVYATLDAYAEATR